MPKKPGFDMAVAEPDSIECRVLFAEDVVRLRQGQVRLEVVNSAR